MYDLDELYCVWQNTLLEDTVSVDIDLDIFFSEDGGSYERYSETFTERAYTQQELAAALSDAGFEVLDISGELTQSPPAEDAQRMIFVTKRKQNI